MPANPPVTATPGMPAAPRFCHCDALDAGRRKGRGNPADGVARG